MPMDETYSPVLHRVNQVIKWRAIHPNAELPPTPSILTKYSNPPEELLQKAKSSLEKVISAGDVKKGEAKASWTLLASAKPSQYRPR
jgi:ATP-dependent DNA helicase 2 subunit 2